MKKPATSTFDEFAEKFHDASKRAGKEQYLIPYFIASHPGSGPEEMIELAVFLKQLKGPLISKLMVTSSPGPIFPTVVVKMSLRSSSNRAARCPRCTAC